MKCYWGKMEIFLKNAMVVFDRILDVGISASAILIFISWFIVCLEVLFRYFFNCPLVWTVEFAEYMMLYCLFIGAAAVLRSEEHIKADILLNWLKPQNRALLTAINSILGVIVCIVLFWFGIVTTVGHYHDGIRTFSALELPQWPFLIAIPIGSFLLLIQFIRRFLDNLNFKDTD